MFPTSKSASLGNIKYFNSIQGWRIKLADGDSNNSSSQNNEAEKSDDLPF